jgi:hypothetical protein
MSKGKREKGKFCAIFKRTVFIPRDEQDRLVVVIIPRS